MREYQVRVKAEVEFIYEIEADCRQAAVDEAIAMCRNGDGTKFEPAEIGPAWVEKQSLNQNF